MIINLLLNNVHWVAIAIVIGLYVSLLIWLTKKPKKVPVNEKDTTFEPPYDEVFYKYTSGAPPYEQKEMFMVETALAKLLVDGVLFVGDFDSGQFLTNEEEAKDFSTICVWVNCNDVFGWGCADAECVTESELPDLYRMHVASKKWGSLKWACKKANLQPQAAVIRDMKKENEWCDLMKSLPKNKSI